MRPQCASDNVVCISDTCHPSSHRLVDGIFERLCSRLDTDNGCSHCLHPKNVQALTLNIDCTHVDDGLHSQPGTNSRNSNTMLTSTSFSDDLISKKKKKKKKKKIVKLPSAMFSFFFSFFSFFCKIPCSFQFSWRATLAQEHC